MVVAFPPGFSCPLEEDKLFDRGDEMVARMNPVRVFPPLHANEEAGHESPEATRSKPRKMPWTWSLSSSRSVSHPEKYCRSWSRSTHCDHDLACCYRPWWRTQASPWSCWTPGTSIPWSHSPRTVLLTGLSESRRRHPRQTSA